MRPAGRVAEFRRWAAMTVMRAFAQTMRMVGIAMMVIGALNFLSFMIVQARLGGTAMNGKTDGERYYLGNGGRYTEVSRSVFDYSTFHGISVSVTHPMMFIGAFVFAWGEKKRKRLAYDAYQ